MTNPILGAIKPDPYAIILGTGYDQFDSPLGINGLFKEEDGGERLDLLCVIAHDPGNGSFRKFIHAAMKQYQTICLWSIINDGLVPILERYGFSPEIDIDSFGEPCIGFRWDKK